ncbi:hypothetical protein LINPERPRIM_LOCUS21421 [Linum perenne]
MKVVELYSRLVDFVKPQLIWAVKEMFDVVGVGVDGLLDRSYIIAKGVSSAFSSLVQNGVVRSVDALTSCDALAPFLKERLKKLLSRLS